MKIPSFIRRKSSEAELADALENTAADWLVHRQAGFTTEEANAFREWLSVDPRHARAFAKFEATWCVLNNPRANGQAAIVSNKLALRARRRTRRNVCALGSVLTVAAALIFAFLPAKAPESVSVSRTTIVQRPDLRALPDGSTLELNAGTVFEVAFTPELRSVRLIRGEAIFAVAKDTVRPFVVTAGDIEVRAVGTAFCVRYDPRQVDVLVTEGTVSVAGHGLASNDFTASGGPAQHRANSLPAVVKSQSLTGRAPETSGVFVTAGIRARLPLAAEIERGAAGPEIVVLSPAEIQQELAWRGKRLEFTGTPLSEAIEWFNRQNRLQISVAEPSVLKVQVTGIYWADDPDGFVSLLETGLHIKAARSEHSIVLR